MMMLSTAGVFLGLVSTVLAAGEAIENYQGALETRLFPEWTKFWASNNNAWPSAVESQILQVENDRQSRLRKSSACTPQPNCLVSAYMISSTDQASIANALSTVNASTTLQAVWPQYVNGTNHIFSVYGDGTNPLYPAIDAISYAANESEYELFLGTLTNFTLTQPALPPPLDAFSLAGSLLSANTRLESLFYSDLWTNPEYNALALARSKTLDWSLYQYAAILIPGEGPEIYDVPLSPLGKLRSRIAVSIFNSNRTTAPFLIPSGGNVHPNLTQYTEAVEMGKWIKTQLGVAAELVVLEPHARHTTTNLRNVARVLETLGAPAGKKVLIVTDMSQRNSIVSPGFAQRCQYELGYVTGQIGPTVDGHFGVEWVPDYAKCARVDPIDPLDP